MSALRPQFSRRRGVVISVSAALALGVVVGMRFARSGELVRIPLAAVVGLFVVPAGYVVARTPPRALTARLFALASLLLVGLLLALAALLLWFRSMPGMQGVGPTGLLLFAMPTSWLAAAATLRYVDG